MAAQSRLPFLACWMYFPGQLPGACGGVVHHALLRVGFWGEAPGSGGNEGERATVAVTWHADIASGVLGMHHRQNMAENSKVPQDGIQHQPVTCTMLLFIRCCPSA